MSDTSITLLGARAGRFKVTECGENQLVLAGRNGFGTLLLLAGFLAGAWAVMAWVSVFSGHSRDLHAAFVLTVLALIGFWSAVFTLGTRLIFDGKNCCVTRSSLFGLGNKTLGETDIGYVSLLILPATLKRREQVFLQLMNHEQLVSQYVAHVRTDRPKSAEPGSHRGTGAAGAAIDSAVRGNPRNRVRSFPERLWRLGKKLSTRGAAGSQAVHLITIMPSLTRRRFR